MGDHRKGVLFVLYQILEVVGQVLQQITQQIIINTRNIEISYLEQHLGFCCLCP